LTFEVKKWLIAWVHDFLNEDCILNKTSFFRRSDWIALGVTFFISLVVYTLTLQPTVGLEDSGELIVASDYLGVPHPPGYPIWSLLTWAFQWIFHKVTFHGYPNPAWAVNFFSAFTGAAACGILALLVSRSGMDFLRNFKKETAVLGEKTESLFCCTAGIASGLLLAFSQGLWSQSVIAEVYAPNILFQTAVLLFLYRWMCEPDNPKPLFIAAFVFGLGLTNHQTLLFMGLAIGLGVVVSNLKLARDFIIVGLFYVLMVAVNKFGPADWAWNRGWDHASFWFWSIYAVVIPVLGLFLPNGKTVCATYLLMLLGLSFYLYMPFSSDQNPPINWGYPRTWEGLMHAITRGQYEKVTLAHVFSSTFLLQVGAYLRDLRAQFLAPIALLALLPFVSARWLGKKNNCWLLTTLVAFVGVGILFIILQNPKIDMQTLFIARVQYIQSHAVYAIWLGYGLLLLMGLLDTVLALWVRKMVSSEDKNSESSERTATAIVRAVTLVGVALVLLLPFSLVWKNYYSKQQEKVVGGSEQNGHDFGWQFGNWQLQGVVGIKKDLWYECGKDQAKFDAEWAKYPNPDYPPPMGTNAIFFGGTDPGRFVPTYMIYCPQVRADVYLITQNALADNTYMAVMRDLYGDQIWIPAQKDSNTAFREYVEGVQSGRINAGADVNTEGGRVQVQGVAGVMQINGILCRQIFDHNQLVSEVKTDESTRQSGAAVVPVDPVGQDGTLRPRDFYVEESYVIPWMYPYLTPHGLIMKINNRPTGITPEMIKNDQDFWNWYVDRLVTDRKFQRDIVARKSFSKLRSAIAGLYSARGHMNEAEAAFKQAVQLYPLSPEAVFRLADLYMRQRRFDEASQVIQTFADQDRYHDRTGPMLEQIDKMKTMDARKDELEAIMKAGAGKPMDINQAFELTQLYNVLQEHPKLHALVNNILSSKLPAQIELQLAQQFTQMRRFDLAETVLTHYLSATPADTRVWIELAVIRLTRGQTGPALEALETAVNKGGDSVRALVAQDARFRPLYGNGRFRTLIPPQAPVKKPMQLNNLF
jgi:thioredoxin-like negative regulator of GroEL